MLWQGHLAVKRRDDLNKPQSVFVKKLKTSLINEHFGSRRSIENKF